MVDLRGVDEMTSMEYELFPEGDVFVTIEKIVHKTTKTGKDAVDIWMIPDGSRQKLFGFSLVEYIDSYLQHFKANGIEDLVGKKAKVSVKHETYEGKTRANVIVPRGLIPANEVVKVITKIIPGGLGEDLLESESKAGNSCLKMTYTVIEGEHKGKSFVDSINLYKGGEKTVAVRIGEGKLVSIVNSVLNLDAKDETEETSKKRNQPLSFFDEKTVNIIAGIRKYRETNQNFLIKIITPSSKEGNILSSLGMAPKAEPKRDTGSLEDSLPDWARQK